MPESGIFKADFSKPNVSAEIMSAEPLLSSRTAGWDNINLQVYGSAPFVEIPAHVHTKHCVAVSLGNCSNVERNLADEYKHEHQKLGDCLLVPKDVEHQALGPQGAPGCILMFIEPHFISKIARDSANLDHVELRPTFFKPDPFIQGAGLALREALKNFRTGSQLYAESLSQALAVHLITKYATVPIQPDNPQTGLSQRQLRQALDYIQENLVENIKLSDLSVLLNMSQHHFCRLFRNSMGISPYQYVLRQRVERAKTLLRQHKSQTITDIASECGFSSPSHLSQKFRQITGVTPKIYRKGS